MRHIKLFEGTSDTEKKLLDIKDEIFITAKKEYMNAVADMLTDIGFTVDSMSKIDRYNDDFAGDWIEVTYDGVNMKITFSHSGGSIGVTSNHSRMRGFERGFSVKGKTLFKKVIKHLERNQK